MSLDLDASPDAAVLAEVLAGGGLRSAYQPLVELDTGSVVAHEGLMRGPAGTPLATPMALLATAAEHGMLPDLERASVRSTLSGLAGHGPTTVFVNLEPRTVTDHLDVVLRELATRRDDVRVVVEVTERALAADPAGMLAGAARLRAAGCAIALDDVGLHPDSLTFIPLLRPEVVKLDLGLLRTVEDPATITVAAAVRAYAEEAGAEVVAEGIERPEDLTRALILGATLGQGWLWGHPGPRPGPAGHDAGRFVVRTVTSAGTTTPFGVVAAARTVRSAPKRLLLPLSQTLELSALSSPVPPLLLSAFQHARNLTPRTARRYAELAERLPLVVGLGVDVLPRRSGGVRLSPIDAGDPLAREWAVVVLGPHESAALVARDVDPRRTDAERPFDFVMTHDRGLVTAAAHALVGRIAPRP